MLTPPSVNPITRYLLENPWPLGTLLAVVIAFSLVAVVRSGQRRWAVSAMVLVAALMLVILVERLVVTAGEHASTVTRDLVGFAERADVSEASALFSDEALMSLGSPNNPGVGIDEIRRRLDLLKDRYAVRKAKISSLRTYTESSNRAVVHLRVTVWFSAQPGWPIRSAWILRIVRAPDGAWTIARITLVEFDRGRTPTNNLFR